MRGPLAGGPHKSLWNIYSEVMREVAVREINHDVRQLIARTPSA